MISMHICIRECLLLIVTDFYLDLKGKTIQVAHGRELLRMYCTHLDHHSLCIFGHNLFGREWEDLPVSRNPVYSCRFPAKSWVCCLRAKVHWKIGEEENNTDGPEFWLGVLPTPTISQVQPFQYTSPLNCPARTDFIPGAFNPESFILRKYLDRLSCFMI